MASLVQLENQRGQLIDQSTSLTAAIAVNQRSVNRLESDLRFATTEQQRTAIRGNISSLRTQISLDQQRLTEVNDQLAQVDAQIAQLRAASQQPTDNAGQETANAQQAREEKANATTPPAGPPPPVVASNADRPNTDTRQVATQAEVRRIDNLMSTPPQTAQPGGVQPGAPSARANPTLVAGQSQTPANAPQPTVSRGAAAAGDDRAALRTFIDQTFGGSEQQIKSQPNVLSQLASYTYNVSIYIMAPGEYKKILRTGKNNFSGGQLLMRSGGAPPVGPVADVINPGAGVNADEADVYAQQIRNARSTVAQQGRNQFFGLDYYLDDLRIQHVMMGKGTGAAHNATELSFKIIEPNGITFLDNLYSATQQYVALRGGNGKQNYAAQNYLMVIKFYGYDDKGNLVDAQKLPVRDSQTGLPTGEFVTVEKYIPFQFTEVKFRVANRLTEYECRAVCPQDVVGKSPGRGVVPYNVELQSQTLSQLFTGNLAFGTINQTGQAGATTGTGGARGLPPVGTDTDFDNSLVGAGSTPGTFGTNEELDLALGRGPTVTAGTSATQNSAPRKADAAPQPTLVSGLVKALNKFQADQVAAGKQQFADKYDIVIVGDVLANAKIVPPGEVNRRQTPMIKTDDPAQAKLGAKQSVANDTKGSRILAGKSILQFIDEAVRSSTYVYNQQIKIVDPKKGTITVNGNPASTVAWFRIGVQAEPLGEEFYDNIRNDFAYNITFQINPYAVSDVKSEWFSRSRFRGTQKRYDYWFTGKNTEILDFQQDYNYLYYMVQTADRAAPRNLYNTRELEKAYVQPNSNQTNQGTDKNVNEAQANATDYLYSPADQSKIKLRILGDPAWIQQGELISGVQGIKFDYKPFGPDGTISYESQDILFEVNFNTPVDYDMIKGVMDPTTNNYDQKYDSKGQKVQAGDAKNSFVYQATRCTSIFSKGRFEQELEGVLRTWPRPGQEDRATQTAEKEKTTAAVKAQSQGRTALIDQPEASVGMSALEMGETGTINYAPTGLSKV